MNGQELRDVLKSGGRVYGTMLRLVTNIRWASALQGAGFDYVIFDNEHSAYSRNQISELSWAFGMDTGAIVKGYRPDFETLRGFGDKL